MKCFEIVAMNCSDPSGTLSTSNQLLTNGPSLPTSLIPGITLIIKCQPGYFWLDGQVNKQINCTEMGKWTYHIACIRINLGETVAKFDFKKLNF